MIKSSKDCPFLTMTTAHDHLQKLLDEIAKGPFSVSQVCAAAGMHPSMVSRWKKAVEPRLSSLDRLAEAHQALLAETVITRDCMSQ